MDEQEQSSPGAKQPMTFNSVDELATAVKKKYPTYQKWDNTKLAASILTKFPNNYTVQGFDVKKYQKESQQAPLERTVGNYASETAKGVGRAAKGLTVDTAQYVKEHFRDPGGPIGAFAKDIYQGLSKGAEARQKAKAEGQDWKGQTLATIEQFPIIGPMVQQAEKGGTSFASPESIGAASEGITLALAPEVVGKSVEVVKTSLKNAPEILRGRAADLNTKVLKTAKAEKVDYNTSVGLEVANQHLVATAKKLPDIIEQRRVKHDQFVQAKADQLTQQGVKIDVTSGAGRILNEAVTQASQRGTLDPSLKNHINTFVKELTTNRTPVPGPNGMALRETPRNMRALTPREIVDLTGNNSILADTAEFQKSRPSQINNLARRIRHSFNEELARVSPEIMKARSAEAKLIEARVAAREAFEKIKNDRSENMRRYIYSGVAPIMLMEAVRMMGVGYFASVGGLIAVYALTKSTLSRTARASIYARAAEITDGLINGHAQAPQGIMGAPQPQGGGFQPQGPQLPVNRPLSPAPAGGGSPPVANRLALLGRGSPPASQTTSSPVTSSPAASAASAASAATSVAAPSVEARPPLETQPPVKPPTRPPKTTGRTLGNEKAIMDKIDDFMARVDNPKSGADRVAAQRGIEDIKKMLDKTGTVPDDVKARLRERLMTRERVARFRERQASQVDPNAGAATSSGEAIASGGNPEQLMLAVERGYGELEKMPGGKTVVEELRSAAKRGLTAEQQFHGIIEAAQFLRQHGAEFAEDEK